MEDLGKQEDPSVGLLSYVSVGTALLDRVYTARPLRLGTGFLGWMGLRMKDNPHWFF